MLTLVLSVLAGLVGLPALWAFVIDALKYFQVVNDGTASKWSAGLNLLSFLLVTIAVIAFPNFNIAGVDKSVFEAVQLAVYAFGFLVQMGVSDLFHKKVLARVRAFSFSAQRASKRAAK